MNGVTGSHDWYLWNLLAGNGTGYKSIKHKLDTAVHGTAGPPDWYLPTISPLTP